MASVGYEMSFRHLFLWRIFSVCILSLSGSDAYGYQFPDVPVGTSCCPCAGWGEGANGADGPNGVDEADVPNGADGPNGANGVDGADGPDGVDGADGVDGRVRLMGLLGWMG